MVVALLAGGCSSDGGTAGTEGTGSTATPSNGGGSTETSAATDASLIPPSDATSPTSGPPNTDPLAGAGAPAAATCEGYGARPASAADDLELRVQLRETLETGHIRWALTVTNRGDTTATLVYPTAQDGDVVLRQDSGVVYRWSDGAAFAQEQRCQLIGAGQEYQFSLRGTSLDVAPGDYLLTASLSADPAPEPARIDVTVVDPEGN